MKNMNPSKAAHGNAGGAPGQMLAGMAEGSLRGAAGWLESEAFAAALPGTLAVRPHRLGSRNAESVGPHRHLDARQPGGPCPYRSACFSLGGCRALARCRLLSSGVLR